MKQSPMPPRTKPLRSRSSLRWNPAATKKRKLRNQERAKLWAGIGLQKPAQEIDEDYKAWIRDQPCAATGRRGTMRDLIECCHVNTVGAGGSDYNAIPLLESLHRMQHLKGFKTFARTHGIDYIETIKRLNALYEKQTGNAVNRRTPL